MGTNEQQQGPAQAPKPEADMSLHISRIKSSTIDRFRRYFDSEAAAGRTSEMVIISPKGRVVASARFTRSEEAPVHTAKAHLPQHDKAQEAKAEHKVTPSNVFDGMKLPALRIDDARQVKIAEKAAAGPHAIAA